METFYINLYYFTEESREDALKICGRMGWCYDDEGGGKIAINVPMDDLGAFNLIFEGYL